jgi:hypothetical protein
VLEVVRTGSGPSCPMKDYGINGDEISGSAIRK